MMTPDQPRLGSPLFTLFLVGAAALGLPLPLTALIAGALAWGLACVAVFGLGRTAGMPVAGAAAGALLACGRLSVLPAALATEVPWILCWVWGALAAAAARRWRLQLVLLALLLATRLDLATLSLAILLLVTRARGEGRLPRNAFVCVGAIVAAWLAAMALDWVALPVVIAPLRSWGAAVSAALADRDLYGFGVPFVALGCAALLRRSWGPVAGAWAGIVMLSGPENAGTLASSMALWCLGAGVEAVARWLNQRAVLRLSRERVAVTVALVATVPIFAAQTISWVRAWPVRPDAHQALVGEAADWIRDRAPSNGRLMGSAQIGYLSRRPAYRFEGASRDERELSVLVAHLRADPPQVCVSSRGLAWDDLQRTGWFRNTYYPAAAFFSDYDPLSPIRVWLRRPVALDLGDAKPLSVRLPDGSAWVGCTYAPDRVTPGEVVSVTLFVHEPPDAATALTSAGRSTVYLRSPGEGEAFAWSNGTLGRRLALDDPEIGEVWAETYAVTTPPDMPVGAYYLSASRVESGSDSLAHLYQDEITFPIDRVTLGYVVAPWRGPMDRAIPVGATLGAGSDAETRFTLLAYDVGGEVSPGGAVAVTLYWEAQGDMAGATEAHFVFVHLLDADGQLVAQHDGPPAAGRYPLAAWIPGEPVPDAHTLVLDPGLPTGTYALQAGVYTWPTLGRLPAWDASEARLPDDVVRLGNVEIK